MEATSYQVEGKVFEVLYGCGLASVSSKQGSIYTVDRHTPGIAFDELHKDQILRCMVDLDSKRVLRADLIALANSQPTDCPPPPRNKTA